MPRKLSLAAARRVAVAATGLAAPRPKTVGTAALRRTIGRLGVLQLDSVNVFERSHYLPLFARLGPYDKAALDRLLGHENGRRLGDYTEEIAHEAAVIPVADRGLWGWRRAAETARLSDWAAARQQLLGEVLDEFRERGPLRVRDLEHPENMSRGGGWWNKNEVHGVSTVLFRGGDLTVVGRERFERVFAATSSLPRVAEIPDLPRAEAVKELLRRASVAMGVATLDDLADYPRIKLAEARAAVSELEADGHLEPVAVESWRERAWLAPGTVVPRSVSATALLSPFDPLVWHRPRALRLFDFHYRISIYTPEAQREHGYYVLPVLVDDNLVGRVDLKSDRKAGLLRVQHAHVEPQFAYDAQRLARRVAPVLHEAAAWQGLSDVSLTGPGTWAPTLRRALG